jgi:succinyl-CoA synthetase beta subunit
MYLTEVQAKGLLKRAGLPVPSATLMDLQVQCRPSTPALKLPIVVKAQVPTGRRGKRGGIRFVGSETELSLALEELSTLVLDSHRVRQALLEEWITVSRELYVALTLDRGRRKWSLLASPAGGVEVEQEAANTLARWPFAQLLGIPGYVRREAAAHLGLAGRQKAQFNEMLDGLFSILLEWGAMLVEINPLAVTPAGDLIALDAKIVLDDNAQGKWPEPIASLDPGNSFERALSDLGAVGVDIPGGQVAIVTSGAGIAMATMDCLAHYGGTTRAFVDLGGAVIRDYDTCLAVIHELQKLEPDVYLFNFFFQLADSTVLATAIRDGFGPQQSRIVARFKGKNDTRSRELVSGVAEKVTSEFVDACRSAAELSREGTSWQS